MIAEYKDRKTGEVFEVFIRNRNDVQDIIINEKTGNIADKQFSSGFFKIAGQNFPS